MRNVALIPLIRFSNHVNNEKKMKDVDPYSHGSLWPINGTSHGIQNGQAEREQFPCMVFLRKFGLGALTEQSS